MYSAIPPTIVHSEIGLERAVDLTTARPRLWQLHRVLKHDAASTVWLLADDEMSVVAKRQRLNTWRRRGDALLHGSPARRAWKGAHRLRLLGFPAPRPLAVLERRAAGLVWECVYVSAELPYPRLDTYWRKRAPHWSVAQRRRFIRALATYVRCFHATGLYTGDLRDANLLVAEADPQHWRFCLVDLDRIRRPFVVSRRRRFRNLVQLDRTAGRAVRRTERLAFLYEYLGGRPSARKRRAILRRLARLRIRKDREYAKRRARRETPRPDAEPPARPPGAAASTEKSDASPGVRAQYSKRAGPPRSQDDVRPSIEPLSCIVVCHDEEQKIRRCLESVEWCDEIVVVDSYSTDRTVEICREFTDRIIQRPWPGYVEQKRFALSQARHEWVLNVDADEEVSPALRDEIHAVLRTNDPAVDGYYVPRLVHYLGRWWRRGWYPSARLRLFRKRRVQWGGRNPHEKVLLDGTAGRLRGDLLHFTYEDVRAHLQAVNRLSEDAGREMAGDGQRRRLSDLVLRPAWRCLRFSLVQGCVWYGVPGLFVSVTAGVYVFLKYAKLREHVAASEARA